MNSLVVGLGEIGQPLYEILSQTYDVGRVDPAKGLTSPLGKYDVMNICIPYSAGFGEIVKDYQNTYNPGLIINHSTVPVGTTATISNAVHSPIVGDHTNMVQSIKKFIKWIGGEKAEEAQTYLRKAGIICRCVMTPEETELLKLMCLAKYGMSIAFAQYQKDIFDKMGFDYDHVLEWDTNYNYHVVRTLQRPLIYPPNGKIGGHCIVPGTGLLNFMFPNAILNEVLKLE
uniref:Uncharacterized protein n=1 Tax=viral metagenome TaxID=1070528 RepID=A0A6M3IP44_9ZZZZ